MPGCSTSFVGVSANTGLLLPGRSRSPSFTRMIDTWERVDGSGRERAGGSEQAGVSKQMGASGRVYLIAHPGKRGTHVAL